MSRNASKETTLGDVSYRLEAMTAEDGVTTGSISVSSTGELVGHLTAQREHLAALEWALSEVTREGSTVEEARQKHPTAYARWTAEEEAELVRRHAAGATVDELAEALGRKPSAIERRLERLGKRS
jgi:DNA-directed RNA polymerase specialized sigma24 family protein